MAHRRRALHFVYAAVALVVAGAITTGAYVAQADTNGSSKRLVVYDNNMENLAPCNGNDYTKLLSYMKKQDKSPDILTIQQVSNAKQLKNLTARLSHDLPGTFAGTIAVANPGSMGYKDGCKTRKNQQTNAIIYRTGRLAAKRTVRWRSDAPANPTHGTGPCRNLDPTSSSQDRVENVAVKFYDKVSHKHVSVASIHWPTAKWNGPKCAHENIRETKEALNGLGGSLEIFGGDTNATDSATRSPRSAAIGCVPSATTPSASGASTTSWPKAPAASATSRTSPTAWPVGSTPTTDP
jgi:hypothetical protein